MIEAWRNGLIFGGAGVAAAALAQARGAWKGLPVVLIGLGALAFGAELVDRAWLAESLLLDAPWAAAAALALWAAQARTGWLRARSWPMVVLLTALFGDALIAVGLAAVEPDATRRARLVIAASGASLLTRTGGASSLLLGWGGWEAVGLGVALAAVGWVGGGRGQEYARPELRVVIAGLLVPLGAAVLAWFVIVGGAADLAARGLESLPLQRPRDYPIVALLGSIGCGTVGDEGVMALLAREVQLRALSIRGDWLAASMRVGLAVGGGLPLLVLTRSRLRVGIPLWLAQAGLAVLWCFLRS